MESRPGSDPSAGILNEGYSPENVARSLAMWRVGILAPDAGTPPENRHAVRVFTEGMLRRHEFKQTGMYMAIDRVVYDITGIVGYDIYPFIHGYKLLTSWCFQSTPTSTPEAWPASRPTQAATPPTPSAAITPTTRRFCRGCRVTSWADWSTPVLAPRAAALPWCSATRFRSVTMCTPSAVGFMTTSPFLHANKI